MAVDTDSIVRRGKGALHFSPLALPTAVRAFSDLSSLRRRFVRGRYHGLAVRGCVERQGLRWVRAQMSSYLAALTHSVRLFRLRFVSLGQDAEKEIEEGCQATGAFGRIYVEPQTNHI